MNAQELKQKTYELVEGFSPTEIALAKDVTQHRIALAFKERYKDAVRFNASRNEWLTWNGKYWQYDTTQIVVEYARSLSAALGGKRSETFHFIKGVQGLAATDQRLVVVDPFLDKDHFLLNTVDGTYDLRTGQMRPHDPQDMITNIAGYKVGDGYGFRFPQFLREITMGNQELEDFLQVSLGACLSGGRGDHWFLFWYGQGANGKSTLAELVYRVMGSYAKKINSSMLMAKKHDSHPTEIAHLQGCRLALASEVDTNARWNESRLKELTGDGVLNARYMYGNDFNFVAGFKMLILGNHRPQLTSIDEAIRRRFKITPFNSDFSNRQDNSLSETLDREGEHVLRWLLDGHLKWYQAGRKLPKCDAIERELEDFLSSQSTVKNWVDECLTITNGDKRTAGRDLFNHFKEWKEGRGEYAGTETNFGTQLKKLIGWQKLGKVYYWAIINRQI